MTIVPESSQEVKRKTRVLVVDDSAVIRTVITRILGSQDDMEIVGTAVNGEEAVKNIRKIDPDIVILDIEMPVMDGITALPLMLKEKPGVKVLICSTLSARGADVSIQAMRLGAADCILKPGGDAIVSAHEFQENLVQLVRSISLTVIRRSAGLSQTTFSLRRPLSALPPKVVAIGSSTGGPAALMKVLSELKDLPVPVVVTQHMPKTFTAILAEHISQSCGLPCSEGREGDVIQPGHVYLAPGGQHMTLEKSGDKAVIRLNQGEPENFCRPSVNPMLRSLVPIYGSRILVVMLTGMGSDGSQAGAQVVEQGGQIIAQDEETSVVWGMPGAVANAGLCSAVLPLHEIGEWVKRAIRGG